ncbi:MAG: Flp pilus assembly protein CpaB [Anaerolineae bacterium]
MGRLRGCLWLTAGLVIAIAAAVVAYITLTNAIVKSSSEQVTVPKVGVVVTTHALTVRSLITQADVQIKEVPVDAAPEGSLASVDDAIGKMVTTDLYAGEIIVAGRLVDPTSIAGDGRTALIISENQVLMAFPAGDLLSTIGILKPGDHVDILVTFDFPVAALALTQGGAGTQTQQQKNMVTFSLMQNLTIAAIVGGEQQAQQTGVLGTGGAQPAQTTPKNPDAILLTVSPQDALVLKYVKDNGGVFDLVLRAPGDEQPYETVPVEMQWLIDRYAIPLTGAGG